ncbi:uncharacterized protein [Eleutherodactylus coqui]
MQIHPKVDRKGAFECSLCKMSGPLHFIIFHTGGFKHRDNYLRAYYKHLIPTYQNLHSYKAKKKFAREQAFKVEREESSLTANALENCTSGIGKSEFWKFGIMRQEKLEERKRKLSAYKEQKKKVLQYLETLVITSEEEADLVKNLTEELEVAMDMFNWSTNPRYKSHKHEHKRRSESSDERYSRHSDTSPNKMRSIWYEKEQKPSRSVSKDMSLKVTFSTGSENEAKSTDVQQPSTTCPLGVASGNFSEATESLWHQKIKVKCTRKQSTDVEKWESLFANHHPEMSGSTFSWGRKSPSLNTEESQSVEKKMTRRASLVALSAFTLFSQEEQEHEPPSCQPGSDTLSSPQSPGSKGNLSQDKGPQQEGNIDQELPCSSDVVNDEAGTMDDKVMHTEPEQLDEKCKSIPNMPKFNWHFEAETSCGPLSDVNATGAQALESSHVLDASSEHSDFKACGSRHLDTESDNQDADSSVLSETLTSGKLYASGRQLSPQVLQLLKGKDTNSIVRILKTLCPFYPALQELDLEVFAEELSKTGAIPK